MSLLQSLKSVAEVAKLMHRGDTCTTSAPSLGGGGGSRNFPNFRGQKALIICLKGGGYKFRICAEVI